MQIAGFVDSEMCARDISRNPLPLFCGVLLISSSIKIAYAKFSTHSTCFGLGLYGNNRRPPGVTRHAPPGISFVFQALSTQRDGGEHRLAVGGVLWNVGLGIPETSVLDHKAVLTTLKLGVDHGGKLWLQSGRSTRGRIAPPARRARKRIENSARPF